MFLKLEIWISVVCKKKNINMDEEFFDENLLLLLFLLLSIRKLWKSKRKKNIRPRPPTFWVRNTFKKEKNLVNIITWFKRWEIVIEKTFSGRYHLLLLLLLLFLSLLVIVVTKGRTYFNKPLIRKSSSRFQKSISASERFALTLRFFATGNSQETLSYSFRIGRAPVSKIVSKTCEAICSALTEKYLSYRKCEDDWLHILQKFQEMWNIPYTIGCLTANVFEWNVPN